MFVRVLAFLLETIFFVLIASALLRAYMNALRINMTAQPGVFVMAVTDWLVKPLRRVLPQAIARSKLDTASLLAAALLAMIYGLLTLLLLGGMSVTSLGLALPLMALQMLVRVGLQTLFILVLGYAILSWVQPGSYAYGLLARLVAPVLSPIQRVVPTLGGVDLSALLLLLLLQIGLMLVG
jgi:YggT family protein